MRSLYKLCLLYFRIMITRTPRASSNVHASFAIVSIRSLCKVSAVNCLTEPSQFLVGHRAHAFCTADWPVVFVRITVSRVLLYPVLFVGIYRFNFAEGDVRCRLPQ